MRSVILLSYLAIFVVGGLMIGGQIVRGDEDAASLTPAMQRFQDDQRDPITRSRAGIFDEPCVNGLSAGVYECDGLDLAAFLSLTDLDGTTEAASDIWGWTSANREFALLGRRLGVDFVEITNPTAPVVIGHLPSHIQTYSSRNRWKDVKVYQDHAYIVSEQVGHGMQIFDLTQLLTATASTTFTETAHYGLFGNAHNIVINEDSGFAYGVGSRIAEVGAEYMLCGGGLHMIDLADPANPTYAGCFGDDGYTHDAQCVMYNGPDMEHVGKEICFASNEDTLTIADVTVKTNPLMLSRTTYPGSSYTHQNWITEDHQYVLVNDEKDELDDGHNTRTRVFDVRDLDAPSLEGFQDSTEPAIDHNLYIQGHTAYLSNYRAGLRVYDVANAANASLPEIGFFDVYTGSNQASFTGTWSNYPYFDSSTIVVSHISDGLFVLTPNADLIDKAQDFTMWTDDLVVELCWNESVSTAVNIDSIMGFDNTVLVTALGAIDEIGSPTSLPAGLSVSVSSNPVMVTADTSGTPVAETATLTFSANTPALGDHLIRITGRGTTAAGKNIVHHEYLKLTVKRVGECVPTAVNVDMVQTTTTTVFASAVITLVSLLAFMSLVVVKRGYRARIS